MKQPDQPRSLIGMRTAMFLFALLIAAAFVTLRGMPLAIALIIVLALAVKAYVHHLRGRIE